MAAISFRIVDASSYDVLATVADEAAIETFLLANGRYIVARVPLKGATIIETNVASLNVPGQ